MSDSNRQETSNGDGYEKKDVNVKMVLIVGIAIIAFIAVCLVFLTDVFVATREKMTSDYVLKPVSVALRELRAKENEELTTYSLLDSKLGIYRIPISRAMELLAEEAYQAEQKQGAGK